LPLMLLLIMSFFIWNESHHNEVKEKQFSLPCTDYTQHLHFLWHITTLFFLSFHIFRITLPPRLWELFFLLKYPKFYLKCVSEHSSFSSTIGLFQAEVPITSGYRFEKRQSWAASRYVKPQRVW
jgi:hypothetical protein